MRPADLSPLSTVSFSLVLLNDAANLGELRHWFLLSTCLFGQMCYRCGCSQHLQIHITPSTPHLKDKGPLPLLPCSHPHQFVKEDTIPDVLFNKLGTNPLCLYIHDFILQKPVCALCSLLCSPMMLTPGSH